MKNSLTSMILLLCLSSFIQAQNKSFQGLWKGELEIAAQKLPLEFKIELKSNVWTASMKSTAQSPVAFPSTSVEQKGDSIHINLSNLKIAYRAKLVGDKLEGMFKQGMFAGPLTLEKAVAVKRKETAPQKNYREEEVRMTNQKAGLVLAGTLALPPKEGKYPVVVLVSGSGPQDRNQEILGHKPFLVLTEYLVERGIAVLRYDDRGVGHSTGNFAEAITDDFVSDAQEAVNFLREHKAVQQDKIAVLGHSEGALVASMLAAQDKKLHNIILWGGPGIPCSDLMLLQQKLIADKMGVPSATTKESQRVNKEVFAIIKSTKKQKKLESKLRAYLKEETLGLKPSNMTEEAFIEKQMEQIANPWMLNFLRLNPADYLSKVKCPVLALNGSLDLQVPAEQNLGAIQDILKKAKNKHFRVEELEGLNHLFQKATTGLPMEYSQIEEALNNEVLERTAIWLKEQFEL